MCRPQYSLVVVVFAMRMGVPYSRGLLQAGFSLLGGGGVFLCRFEQFWVHTRHHIHQKSKDSPHICKWFSHSQYRSTMSSSHDPKSADVLFARELSEMSMDDREQVYYDVHGVSRSTVEETDDLIDQSLAELDKEIAKIDKKKAFDLARVQNSSFVDNRKSTLKFLRADEFDCRLAAKRIVRFYQSKLELFGESKLTQDIRLKDLSEEDDRACVESGLGQLLPRRDRAGRAIFAWSRPLLPTDHCPIITRSRVLFYLLTVASEDEETQKKGMIIIFLSFGPKQVNGDHNGGSLAASLKLPSLLSGLPIRFFATHLCHDNSSPLIGHVISIIRHAVSTALRLRLRCHHGTAMECIYELMTFGIPANEDVLPMNGQGEFSADNHKMWLKERRKVEDDEAAAVLLVVQPILLQRVAVPNQNDVVFGRDKYAQDHLGNVHFIFLIENRRDEHEGTPSRRIKCDITDEVIETVHERGGKFLRKDEVGWVVVDHATARSKVANAFRSRRKLENKKAWTQAKKAARRELVSPDGLPIMNGQAEFSAKNHKAWWLKERRKAEDDEAAAVLLVVQPPILLIQRVAVPDQNDVVFGRDKYAQDHPGNAQFIFLIENRRDEHEGTPNRKIKFNITDEVIETVHERGGKFLRKDEVGWVVVDHDTARNKVANAFRSRRKLDNKKALTQAKKAATKGLVSSANSSGDEILELLLEDAPDVIKEELLDDTPFSLSTKLSTKRPRSYQQS